jgi:hypothetical protein
LQENGRERGRWACKLAGLRKVEAPSHALWCKTQRLRCFMVMVVHPIHTVIVQVQRRIALVVVVMAVVVVSVVRWVLGFGFGLGMDPGVGDVGAQLCLTQRREPHQRLPQQDNHQEGGAGASGHGGGF